MLSTKSANKKTYISTALAVTFAFIYFAIWAGLASPFRAFPGDDAHFARNLVDIAGSTHAQLTALQYPNPVYYLLDYSVFRSCRAFVSAGCNPGEVIQHVAVASNAAIVLLLGLLVFMLTKSLSAQLAAQAIYAFAAWPVTYHFMVSYTVTTAALVLVVFYLIIGSSQNSRLRPGIAGIVTGLVLWSSSSGPLTTGVLIIAVVFLLWDGGGWRELLIPSRYHLRRLGFFAAGFFICAAFFGYSGLQPYIEHLLGNTNSDHYAGAYRRFGYVPKPPFFTYLHTLYVYGQVGLVTFVAALIAVPVLMTKSVRTKFDKKAIHSVAVLVAFVVLHAILVDLLPFTKLARAHFPVYPVSVAVICIAGFQMYGRSREKTGERRALFALLLIAFMAMLYEGMHLSAETRSVRITAAKYVNDLRSTSELYVLQNDPHQLQMRTTFDWQLYQFGPHATSGPSHDFVDLVPRLGDQNHLIRLISATKFSALLAKPHRDNIVLLLGPYGPGSGLSVAVYAMTRDFYPGAILDFKSLVSQAKEVKVLPYYMHYPPFLLEEEICEALYFDGKIPDYRNPSMGITVLRF